MCVRVCVCVCASHLVTGVCSFLQTGSGKTFTMEGQDSGDGHQRGMIARAVEQVFASSKELMDKGWQVRTVGGRGGG